MRAGTSRADLGYFRRAEAARKSELNLVGHVLIAQHQNGMLFESCAGCRVSSVVGSDIRERHATQFGRESRTQRDSIHRQFLAVLVRQAYGKRIRPATRLGTAGLVGGSFRCRIPAQ